MNSQQKYHFAVVDANPKSVARFIIIVLLLREVISLHDQITARIERLCTMFYTFTGTIMPPIAFGHLQRIISDSLAIIRDEEGTSSRDLP